MADTIAAISTGSVLAGIGILTLFLLDVNETLNVLGIEVPQLTIPITEGKSLSVIIESAVTSYILKKQGIDTNLEFKERLRTEILRNGENND